MISLSLGGDSGLGGNGRMDRPSGVGPVQKGTSAMQWRHLCLVRAFSAAGLISGMTVPGRVDRDGPDTGPRQYRSRPRHRSRS